MIDWLHTVDQVIGHDALGELFFEALQPLPGDNQHARLRPLRGHINQYYQDAPVSSKLAQLILEMVKKARASCQTQFQSNRGQGL